MATNPECRSCHHQAHPRKMCPEPEYSGASLTEVGPCCCMFEVTEPHERYCICTPCLRRKEDDGHAKDQS